MSAVVFVGHTSPATPWVRGELARVLAKLAGQMQLDSLQVALEPGTALDAAETALLLEVPVVLHPLYPGPELVDRYAGHPGMADRLGLLWAHRGVDIADSDGSGANRARRRRRSTLLADTFATHLVVYDGRDRGSVLDHLQLVMGTHDVIQIDPSDQTTHRMIPEGASPCPPTPSTPSWSCSSTTSS